MSETREHLVGEVSNFFAKIMVAGIEVMSPIKVGDKLRFEGVTTDFIQDVTSMQMEHQNIAEAKPGDSVGMKVRDKVRKGDKVYLVTES